EGLGPLVRDEDVAVIGYRDAEEASRFGSRDVRESAMHLFDLNRTQDLGVRATAEQAVGTVLANNVEGFWIHCDADVLDDAVMPAVGFRLPSGLRGVDLTGLPRRGVVGRRAGGLDGTVL